MSIYYKGEEIIIKITEDKIFLNKSSFFYKDNSDLRRLNFDYPKFIEARIDSVTEHDNGRFYIEATAITDNIKNDSSFFIDNRKFNIEYFRLANKEKFSKGEAFNYKSKQTEYFSAISNEKNYSYQDPILNKKGKLLKDNIDSLKQPFHSQIKTILISLNTKVDFTKLKFRDGYILCDIYVKEVNEEIEIKIPQNYIMHEFGSLINYFKKMIGPYVFIEAELKIELSPDNIYINHVVIKISSEEIKRISADLIDQIQVKHLFKNMIGKKNNIDSSLFKLLQENQIDLELNKGNRINEKKFFEIINNPQYGFKHNSNINFLSQHNKNEIFRLKFFLASQSFLFLLEGKNNYFFILEVLNKDYATYLWSYPKDISLLKKSYYELYDSTLQFELNRLVYLKEQPLNFHRIIHDDINKSSESFLEWKNKLNHVINS